MQIHALAEDIDRLRRLEKREQTQVDVKHVKVLEYGADEHRTKALVEGILKGKALECVSIEFPQPRRCVNASSPQRAFFSCADEILRQGQ